MELGNSFENFKPDEADIIANKKANKVYVANFPGGYGKYISKVFDDSEEPADMQLQISPRVEVRITYKTEDNQIKGVQISKFSQGKKNRINLTTLGFEGVLGILKIFSELDLSTVANKSIVLDSGISEDPEKLRRHLNTIFADETGLRLINELAISKGIQIGDISNVSHMRKSLKLFENMLASPQFFRDTKSEWECRGDESVWQKFFEDNNWVFGYGLSLVYNKPLDGKKLEEIIAGTDITQSGKRADGVMKSLGKVGSLRLIEIKTHKTELLRPVETSYRVGCWKISEELNGGVIQSQQSTQKTQTNLQPYLRLKDHKTGNPTGEEIYSYLPKAYLIVGSLDEFNTEHGVNIDKFSSFELFRRNLVSPEIVTFDELYQRACRIVAHVAR